MQRLGFIHDMLDVKVLILFVTARSSFPMTMQEIYEACYQDDCLSISMSARQSLRWWYPATCRK